jgi:hypothetical protein
MLHESPEQDVKTTSLKALRVIMEVAEEKGLDAKKLLPADFARLQELGVIPGTRSVQAVRISQEAGLLMLSMFLKLKNIIMMRS